LRTPRVYGAAGVLGATLIATVWLYSYRTWSTDLNADGTVAIRVRVQPWWGLPASVALMAVGVVVSLSLLPRGRRLIEAFFVLFARLFSAKPSS
jgi:uncharacterized membrane protein